MYLSYQKSNLKATFRDRKVLKYSLQRNKILLYSYKLYKKMILKLVNRAINQGSKVSAINMQRISRAVEVNFQRNELLKL